MAHLDPDPLILAAAVLQIQHRVARGGVGLISRRGIHEDVTPGIGCLGKVVLDEHIAVRHIFQVIKIDAGSGISKPLHMWP